MSCGSPPIMFSLIARSATLAVFDRVNLVEIAVLHSRSSAPYCPPLDGSPPRPCQTLSAQTSDHRGLLQSTDKQASRPAAIHAILARAEVDRYIRRTDGRDCGDGGPIGASARGIAAALAERGFTVACLTRSGRGPEGLDLPAYPVDVTDAAGLARALDAAAAELGGLEGLVNNAGVHLQGPSADFPVEDFARTMAVNATAVFASSPGRLSASQGERRRHRRQYRLLLGAARRQRQRRLLRLQGRRLRTDALPRPWNGPGTIFRSIPSRRAMWRPT